MKKIFIVFIFSLFISFNVNAQTYSYQKDLLIKSYESDTVVTSRRTGIVSISEKMSTDSFIPKKLKVASFLKSNNVRNGEIDNRIWANVNLFPFSTIGTVEVVFYTPDGDEVGGYGTGVLIGPDLVFTAAHCVYSDEYGWAQEIKFFPARTSFDVGGALYSADCVEVSIPQTYADLGHDDWALIEVDEAFYDLGYMGFELVYDYFIDSTMYSSGYSSDKNGEQWYTYGNVVSVGDTVGENNTIISVDDFYTMPGHSGAPIYGPDNLVYGVYSYGYGYDVGGGGAGVGIDRPLYSILFNELLESFERN